MQRLLGFLLEHDADELLLATTLLNFLYVIAVMDHEPVEVAARISKRVEALQKTWDQERGLRH